MARVWPTDPRGQGSVITAGSDSLTVITTTTAQPPVYTTLLSIPFVKKRLDTSISVFFTAAVLWSGPAGNKAPVFRMMMDGAVLNASGNAVIYNESAANRIQPVAYARSGIGAGVIPPGPHTFEVEWAYYGGLGATVSINPLILGGDGQHASFFVREILE